MSAAIAIFVRSVLPDDCFQIRRSHTYIEQCMRKFHSLDDKYHCWRAGRQIRRDIAFSWRYLTRTKHSGLEFGIVRAHHHLGRLVDQGAVKYLLQPFQQETRRMFLILLWVKPVPKYMRAWAVRLTTIFMILVAIMIALVQGVLGPFQLLLRELFTHWCA